MRLAVVSLLVAVAAASPARAQVEPPEEPSTVPEAGPPPPIPPDLWMDVNMRRSWEERPPRWFTAAMIDLGWVYLRPRVSFGYGRPFSKWIGVDVNPAISSNAFGLYGGVRVNLPRLNWRAGVRYTWSLYRTYLDEQLSYDRLDFDLATNPRTKMATFETELEGTLPLGPGDLLGLASLSYVTNVPEGQVAFEETLRVMVDPPLVWRVRGGYALRWGTKRQHSAGLVVDVLDVPARDDSLTLRVGPVVRIVLSRRVEVRGSFVVTAVSPDNLGLAGSDFTEIGLRYRWATE
jgi:hypothetical protein